MPGYHHVASIIFLNQQGKFVLQLRDDKPGIRNPGMITAWGGAVESGETILQAAVREVREKTNLEPDAKDLESFGDYPRDLEINGAQILNHVFLLRGVDENSLQVYEGQGYKVIDPAAGTENPLFSALTKELIADYTKK